MAHSFGMDIGDFGPTLSRRLTLVAGFAAVCVLALQLADVGQSVVSTPVRPVAPHDSVQAAHCSQFVELARAKFGSEWKRRLDPRDTLCAEQVQQAWEHDWQPREAPTEPVLQPKIVASPAPPSKIAPSKPAPEQASKTYSLAAVTRAAAGPAEAAGREDANDSRTAATGQKGANDSRAGATGRKDANDSRAEAAGQKDDNDSRAHAAGRKDVNDSSESREDDHPTGAALEDGHDQGAMDAGEDEYDARSFSSSDDRVDDVESDSTRALNNAQVGRRSRYDDDVLSPHDDDSEVDENDDVDESASGFPGDDEIW